MSEPPTTPGRTAVQAFTEPDPFEQEEDRTRKRRKGRISAAVLAFAVSIAGSLVAYLAFRGSPPAPAGSPGVVQIRLDGPPQPIAADDSAAWVSVGTSGSDDVLWRIDAETSEARSLENTRGAQWPAVGEGFAWAIVCLGSGLDECAEPAVLKLHSETGETVATIPLPAHPWHIAVGFGSAWVTTAEGLVRIDAATNEVLGTVPGHFTLLTTAGHWVWATTPDGIARIDPGRTGLEGTTSLAGPCVMTAGAGSMWTSTCGGPGSTGDTDVLTQLDIRDGTLASRSKVDRWGHLVGSDGGLWLVRPAMDSRSDVIVPIDVETGEPAGPGYVLPLPDEARSQIIHGTIAWTPFGAVSAGSIWVTDLGSGTVLRVPLDELTSLAPATDTGLPSPLVSPSG